MQLDTKVLQSKVPSLEEGPMRCSAYNENCSFHRVEKRSIYQHCMDIIKLILCLEVIIFVGWIGAIFISNYYLARPYNEEITPRDSSEWMHDFHGGNFAVTSNSISNDDIVSTSNDVDAITSTERTYISTTPEMAVDFGTTKAPPEMDINFATTKATPEMDINFATTEATPEMANDFATTEATPEMANDFANSEESLENTERPGFNSKTEELDNEFEWPYRIFHIKNDLLNLPLDDAFPIFEKNTNSEKSELDSPKVKITFIDDLVPSALFPNSGLIHVIEDRVPDSNVDTNAKSEIPFPLLKVLNKNYKPTEEENLTVEDDISNDTSEIDSIVKSILDESFEESMDSSESVTLKPVITDVSEDHVSYRNIDSNRKSDIPFPLLKVFDKNYKSTEEENLTAEDDISNDTSEIDSIVKSILDESFKESMDSSESVTLKPVIADGSEDHVSYSNIDSNRKSDIPIPLLKSLDNYKSSSEENLEDENDSSSHISDIDKILNIFQKPQLF